MAMEAAALTDDDVCGLPALVIPAASTYIFYDPGPDHPPEGYGPDHPLAESPTHKASGVGWGRRGTSAGGQDARRVVARRCDDQKMLQVMSAEP